MPIDASIPLRGSQPAAPLDLGHTINNALMIGNRAYALQQMAAQKAAGQDYQAATDPKTGQVNYAKLGLLLHNDPRAAMILPHITAQNLQNIHQQYANKQISLEVARQQTAAVADGLGSLIADGKTPSLKDVTGMIARFSGQGIIDPKEAATIATQFAGLPQNEIPQAIKGLVAMSQHNAYAMSLTPAQQATPVGFTTPSGAHVTNTMGAIAEHGNQLVMPNPNAQANPLAPKQPPFVSTQAVSGPSISGQVGMQGYSSAATKETNRIMGDASTIGPTRASLHDVGAAIESAPTGPMSNVIEKIGGSLSQLGVKNLNSAAMLQMLRKGGAQLVLSQVGAGLGVPTNDKLDTVAAQVPEGGNTKLANQVIYGMIRGMVDYKQAMINAGAKFGLNQSPQKGFEFSQQFMNEYPDTAIFQFHYLPLEIKKAYWSHMDPQAREAFHSQYMAAHQEFPKLVPENPFKK